MNRVITIILLMLLTWNCFSQKDLIGEIEKIGLTSDKLNGQVLKIEYDWHVVLFDSLGNKTLDINKRAQSQDAYFYNSTNQLVSIQHRDTKYPGSNNQLIFFITDTTEICIVHNNASEKIDSAIYVKNVKGQIIRQETYRLESMARHTFYFVYDSLNRVTQIEWFGTKNRLLHKLSIKYDDINGSIEWVKTNRDGVVNESHKIKLDHFGNRIYDLDENGKLIEWEYEYDGLNNWVKRTQKINGKINFSSERKIIYRK
jgi:hypothetical protein